MRDLVDLAGRRVPRLSQSELTARASQKSIKTVVLDPDEGYGSEAGTAAKRCSDLSLELAEKVKARLELKGIAVVLTRRADRRVSPGERLEVVANSNAGALVSIRVAYSDFPDASGPRAYFPSISVDASASKGLVREGGDSVPPEMNFQAFEDNSRVLAGALLEAAKAGTGSAASTDIVPSALYLHRRAPMPSALVVVGYASNRLDSLMLNDEARRDKLADALAGAISAFAGLEANARIPEVAQSQ